MATIANINIGITASTRGLQQGLTRAQRMLKRARGAFNAAFGALAPLAGVVTSALSVSRIAQASDAWTEVNNRIRSVTGSGREQIRVQQRIFDASRRSRASFSAFTSTFAGIGFANESLGLTNDQIIRMTETFFKLGVVGGASGEEAARAAFQMRQSFDGGIVRAEEYNSILENTPLVARAVGTQLGLTMGELRQKMLDGELSAELFGLALLAASRDADIAFSSTNATIGDQFTQIGNSFNQLVGTIQDSGATGNIFSDFLDKIVVSLDFITAAIKNPTAALDDFRLAIRTFMKDAQPFVDFLKTVGDNPLTRVAAFGTEQFLDRDTQAGRFFGASNPLTDAGPLTETNSQDILRELIKMNKSIAGLEQTGTFGP